MTSTLAELGMDSLMGAEIKQTLERNFDLVLSVGEIRNLTMGNLMETLGGSSSDMASSLKANSQVSFKNEVCQGFFARVCSLYSMGPRLRYSFTFRTEYFILVAVDFEVLLQEVLYLSLIHISEPTRPY